MEYGLTQTDDTVHVALSGIINEDAEVSLQTLASKLGGATTVTFNFASVKSINSLGVRAWVQFLRTAEEGRNIIFEECVPDVIMQINMIPSFKDKATIKSFYTHYVREDCTQCQQPQKVLIETASLAPKSIPEPRTCATCNQEMETEELEDEYFAFLLR